MPGFNIAGTSAHQPPNTIETARSHRYIFSVLEPMKDVLIYAHKASRPSFEADVIKIHNGQDRIYRPGQHFWKPLEITFYETVVGSSAAASTFPFSNTSDFIYGWWQGTMINTLASGQYKPTDYRKECQLEMLDGDGNTVWKYSLYGCWPSKVLPSDLSYKETDIADIAVTLQIDRAVESRY
jgi:hypothetical protein